MLTAVHLRPEHRPLVLVRGGGDLASGVIYRLHRAGIAVVVTELPQPLVVRRLVAFAEAVYAGRVTVQGVTACRVADPEAALALLPTGQVPVLVDPEARSLAVLRPAALVDARMTKRPPDLGREAAPLVVGLGPGFVAGENCHAAVETNRGHDLGRVLWQGAPQPDTGIPEAVLAHQDERVLRAPVDGVLRAHARIGQRLRRGDLIAEVAGVPLRAPFDGVLRGLVHDGLPVTRGMKVGDLDPRNDPAYAHRISDKALAVGGGVLEAVLTPANLRRFLLCRP